MAVPAYATDLTDINTNNVFTEADGWGLQTEGGGGQNAITAPELDDFIQGTRGVSRNPFSSSIRGIYYDTGTAVTVAADDAVFFWWKADVAQALDTISIGGVHLTIGTSNSVYHRYHVAGSDTYELGGWRCTPIDDNDTGETDRGSPGTPDFDFFGIMFDIPSSGPSKGYPFKMDMIRHGRSVSITAGEVANPASWDSTTTYADDITRRWGIVQGTDTGATLQGVINWGTASTAVYSRDSLLSIVLLDTLGYTVTDFTQIVFNNASTDVIWDQVSILSLDTLNRGIITVNDNPALEITNSVVQDIDTTTDGGSNSVWDGTKWIGCNEVTAAGGDFLGCQIITPTVDADTSGFIYNETANPNGVLDGMAFTQGTNAHHAIEFGLSSPTTMTLTDMTFTDFDAADEVNGSVLHFLRTSGTVTVTLDGTTEPSYKSAGADIVFVTGAVTVSATSVTSTGAAVGSTRMFIRATATTGTLPSDDAVVGISNSGTTATVDHTGHGLKTSDQVWIQEASLDENNGVFTITVTDVDTYTYTMGSSPGSSPTGSITCTFIFLFGLSNGSGYLSMSRSISADQSVSGWARKSSAADDPKYKTGPITGVVSSSTGADYTPVMIPD